jgi:hypothetical protein
MIVFYINGAGGSGKSEFIQAAANNFSRVHDISSIDGIKEKAKKEFGWDGQKDEKGRELLRDLKAASIKYNDGPVEYIKTRLTEIKQREEKEKHSSENIIFVTVREAEEIKKLQACMPGKTISVERSGIEVGATEKEFIKANKAFKYDFTYKNEGTINDLQLGAVELLTKILQEKPKK